MVMSSGWRCGLGKGRRPLYDVTLGSSGSCGWVRGGVGWARRGFGEGAARVQRRRGGGMNLMSVGCAAVVISCRLESL